MLHLRTKLLPALFSLIIGYTHPPSLLWSTALPSKTHIGHLKSPQYSGNWRLWQVSSTTHHPSLWPPPKPNIIYIPLSAPREREIMRQQVCDACMGRRDIIVTTTSVPAHLCKGGDLWFSEAPLSTTQFLSQNLSGIAIECPCQPPAPNINQPPMMETHTVGQHQRKIKKKQAEEMRAQQQVEEECQQRLQEKKRCAKE
jgi:hypothetical protein